MQPVAKRGPASVSTMQLLLGYVADLELEVNRLRKQSHSCITRRAKLEARARLARNGASGRLGDHPGSHVRTVSGKSGAKMPSLQNEPRDEKRAREDAPALEDGSAREKRAQA